MKRAVLSILTLVALAAAAQVPSWQPKIDQMIDKGEFKNAEKELNKLPKKVRQAEGVRIDSLMTIMDRIRKDFNITPEQGVKMIREKMPEATDAQIAHWKDTRALEVMNIDGQEWWFKKSVRNLWLLGEEFAEKNAQDRDETSRTRQQQFIESMRTDADRFGVRDWRVVDITFTLDVKADAVPAGETIRVWMPYPYENLRQRNIVYKGGNHKPTFSHGSKHHTVYMEAVAEAGKPTHFEYSFSYEVGERHIAQQDLLAMVRPYDVQRPLYQRFTGDEPRHVIITDKMRELAKSIVGDEENPVLQANMLYEWISHIPWAGAREYSTLANIPEYVLLNKHGDCGQVALLYITLARALGIPARWESGYMIHPDDVNYHDWAETYFEGVGWVPTDPSFGRSAVGTPMNSYYATGIDVYRMATNEAVGDKLSPEKTFIRSETVDFQPGEVEWKGGNLYYDKWSSHLEVNGITPLRNIIR